MEQIKFSFFSLFVLRFRGGMLHLTHWVDLLVEPHGHQSVFMSVFFYFRVSTATARERVQKIFWWSDPGGSAGGGGG